MAFPLLFSSRQPAYRNPTGAVTPGTAVHFRLRIPREWQCGACFLHVDRDRAMPVRDGMFWAGMDGEHHEWWECHYVPAEAGLHFYTFELSTAGGTLHLFAQSDGTAGVTKDDPPARWQLTCYDENFTTPDWLCGGVMYQIFPDRFCRSGSPKEGVPDDRRMHENWDEPVDWRADAQGRVNNDDYFGGDLAGIERHLDYLKSLGVTCLYLNPIFEAHSNHRYNTASYERIDPLLGSEEDFRSLARTAGKLGIRILLDGVFSHTGSDSEYFNRNGRYPTVGAYQSLGSPYAPWYHFRHWPNDYTSWWGFDTLPEVDELNPDFLRYITGEDGIVRRWLRAGASGWRLDVADELPDAFIDALRAAVKAENPDALVLGEVWEDASCKQSYGVRRRYLLGSQLDSVMNYPFANAVIDFLRGTSDSAAFTAAVGAIAEHYPPQVLRLLMNHIGTHDTTRALTALAGEDDGGRGRAWQAEQKLSGAARKRGLRLMRLASALQYCLPGVPCLYYGDEAGAEGYRDPFNRAPYPWGREEKGLIAWYRRLGKMRHAALALREGAFVPLDTPADAVAFERVDEDARLLVAVNRSDRVIRLPIPACWHGFTVLLGEGKNEPGGRLSLPALGCAILYDNGDAQP